MGGYFLQHTNYKMARGQGSKKAKRSGSNIFAMFSQRQIQEFKEAFGIMDTDKDGILSASDLTAASAPSASPSLTARPAACSQRLPAQSTSHRWSPSSPRRWPVAPTTTTPSSSHLMHSKLTERLTQKCSSIR